MENNVQTGVSKGYRRFVLTCWLLVRGEGMQTKMETTIKGREIQGVEGFTV